MTKQQELVDWAIERLERFEKEKKLYNLSAIILSLLDVLCGVIALFYASMTLTSIIASILCGTTWGARCIQVIKCEKLAKALKVLSVPSLTYIAVRKRRNEFMKNTKIRNIIIGVLTFLGIASVVLCAFIPVLTPYIEYVIYGLCAILPADLYAIFNNARLTAEEIKAKVDKKEKVKAEKQAKAQLKEKQSVELEKLTAQILEEKKSAEIKGE